MTSYPPSTDLAYLVPVLDRPHRVAPTRAGVEAATPGARCLFIADADDEPELHALEAAGADYIAPGGNYATKIRAGVEATTEPLLFFGADDLAPRAGWLELAAARFAEPGIEVVGVNDLCAERVRRGEHSTHFLVKREYAEKPDAGGDPGPLHAGYFHWYVDDEFVATAAARGALALEHEAIVEHLHPMAGKAPDDRTYYKGRANRQLDKRHFMRRQKLWT